MAFSQYNVSTNGGLFQHATAVTNEAANNVGDYEGDAALNLTAERAEALGQSFWVQDAVMIRAAASLNIGEVFFNPDNFGTIWGITPTAGSSMEASPVTGTEWVLDTGFITLPEKQWLTDVDRTSDSKKFQVLVYAGRLTGDFNVAFTQGVYMKHDISITAFLDDNDDLIKIFKEAE